MGDLTFLWETLLEKKGIDPYNLAPDLPVHVSSKEMNDLKSSLGAKAKDARFLAKIDTREESPELFKRQGLFLVPVKNGEFLVLMGEGFCDIANMGTAVADFESRLSFELLSSRIGDSEMQHLDYAFNCGLLNHHYHADPLLQTIRGRKFSPSFSFSFGAYKVEVNGVQFEVDGGYEGENIIVLVEAKNTPVNNFVIRQLYYPFRAWKKWVPNRNIKLSFFAHNNGIYTLHDFVFRNTDDYNSIAQASTSHYRIVSAKTIGKFKLPLSPSGVNIIPQADDLNKVIELVVNIGKGIEDSRMMAEKLRFDKRQSSYYREAAEALGLVFMEKNKYYLSEAGEAFIEKTGEDRKAFLAEQIMNIPIFFWVLSLLASERRRISKQDIAEWIVHSSHLNMTTANRRSSTIISWLNWFERNIGMVKVINNAVQLA